MMKELLHRIDQQRITVMSACFTFLGIVFIRCLLEDYSNPLPIAIVPITPSVFMHYILFYIVAMMGLGAIMVRYAGHGRRTLKMLILGLPIIWLGPTIDLIATGGEGSMIGYFGGGPLDMFFCYFYYLTPLSKITLGLRLELIIIILSMTFYVWHVTRSKSKAALSFIASYSFLFLLAGFPGFVYFFAHLLTGQNMQMSGVDISAFVEDAVMPSVIPGNSLHTTLAHKGPDEAYQVYSNIFYSHIYYLLMVVGLLGAAYSGYKKKLIALLRNSRLERVAFYLLFLILGMLLAHSFGLAPASLNWVDVLSGIVLLFSWYATWMTAIHMNDIEDITIDRVSNPERPLPQGIVNEHEMRTTGTLWLALSLTGSWIVGVYPFFLNICYHACSFLYSAPPLRLRKMPIIATLFIGIAVLCTFLSGFFFLSTDKSFGEFPRELAFALLVLFTLGVNVKDLKDIKGDREDGVVTLPILFGHYGKTVTAIVFASSFLLVPILLHLWPLIWLSLVAFVIALGITLKKKYHEKWVFVLYFGYLFAAIILLQAESSCSFSSFPFCPTD